MRIIEQQIRKLVKLKKQIKKIKGVKGKILRKRIIKLERELKEKLIPLREKIRVLEKII